MIVFGPKTVTAKELKTLSKINRTFIINQNQRAIEQASCKKYNLLKIANDPEILTVACVHPPHLNLRSAIWNMTNMQMEKNCSKL